MIDPAHDERAVADLLQTADAALPRPPRPPITLATLRARARRKLRQQLVVAAALLTVASLVSLSVMTAHRAPSVAAGLARSPIAARLRAELLERDAKLRVRAAASEARVRTAVERASLVQLHYAENLYRQGLPEGRSRLSTLAHVAPDTLGGREATALLASTKSR